MEEILCGRLEERFPMKSRMPRALLEQRVPADYLILQ